MEFLSLIEILLIINSLTSKRIITIKARKIVYCANAVKFINKAAEAAPKSSVEDVYKLIIKDLTDAIPLLEGYVRPSGQKDQIDANVAKGILAYVYLTMGDYANAAKISQEVIDSGEYPLMSKNEIINSGFNSVTIPSWMWAIDLTVSNSPALPTFWGHVEQMLAHRGGIW